MSHSLVPTLHTVPFHGDQIVTFEHSGEKWVAMRPVVEALGLSWGSQRDKLAEQAERLNCTDIGTVAADGKQRQMLSIPLRKLPGWLSTINPNKIPDDAKRAKVTLFQEESFQALHDYWFRGAAIRGDMEGVVTDLSPKVMSAIGGMVKAILNKALAETVPAIVEARLLEDRRIALLEFKSALEVLRDYGVPSKGRRNLVRRCSPSLMNFCLGEADHGNSHNIPRRCARTGTRLFPVELAHKWWKLHGSFIVGEFLAQQKAEDEDRKILNFRPLPRDGQSA